jgi:hypothetical protein
VPPSSGKIFWFRQIKLILGSGSEEKDQLVVMDKTEYILPGVETTFLTKNAKTGNVQHISY